MKRLATAALTLVATLAPAAGAVASHQGGPGQGSPRDFAVGTGMNEIGRVSFAAHGGPLPNEPVTGHFHAKGATPLGPFNIDGPVTCLTVVGNRASLFYPVRDPHPPAEPDGVLVFLQDNGNPASGDPPDEIGFVPTVGPLEPFVCPLGQTSAALEHGNITIHDGGV